MEKRGIWETVAIIAAIFMAAWVIRGDMAQNTAELRADIAANTAAIAELRGALLSHIGGHGHAPVIAESDQNK